MKERGMKQETTVDGCLVVPFGLEPFRWFLFPLGSYPSTDSTFARSY